MFGKSSRGTAVAVANIESSSVSFSIVKPTSATAADVLFSRYAELPLEERSSGQHLFALKQRLADIAKTTLEDYRKSERQSIKDIYVVVHAPWATGMIISGTLHFQREEYISAKIISDCAAQALSKSAKEENVLDVRQLRIMLNGYRTSLPEGKYAHMVEVAGMRSTCDPKIKEEIVSTLHSVVPSAHVLVNSGAWAVVEAIQAARPQLSDAVCMHVSGEGTEIIVIRGGIVHGYGYVPEGLRTVFARAFPGMHPDEARAAVRRMGRGEASDSVTSGTQEALLKAEPDLARAFGEGLAAMSAQLRLPNVILLIVDPDISPWLEKFFERLDFSQFTVTAQPFSVEALSSNEFGAIVKKGGSVEDLDVSIATAHVLREAARA